MKITINVTDDDIIAGKPNNCKTCPVALAVMRTIPNIVSVFVTDVIGCTRKPNLTYTRLSYPDWVRAIINAFDQTGSMVPFSFEVELPV